MCVFTCCKVVRKLWYPHQCSAIIAGERMDWRMGDVGSEAVEDEAADESKDFSLSKILSVWYSSCEEHHLL